jgi:cellulose synthase/poly-beta-1,6-N-acetylglucosamine synthase-like glycosyltransferase
MLQILFGLFILFLSVFLGTYAGYFAYVRSYAKKPWKLKYDPNFEPAVSILVPTHNEEGTVESKLTNLKDVSYSKEKMEIILADDSSEDNTISKAQYFIEKNPQLNMRIVKQNPRAGKSATLNNALTASTHPIIIVSDADTSWSPDILSKALPYMSDSEIGAITGMGVNRNIQQSWITKAEDAYLNFAHLVRLGESKIHSTIRFEGGFCAYKKEAFKGFDCKTGADDSGTALDIIQNKYRTILVPEAVFYTTFPTGLGGKLKTKSRRATQLMSLWATCFVLLLKNRLLLPKRIAIPEIMLFIFAPLFLLAVIVTALATILLFPFSLFSLVILLSAAGMVIFARRMFLEVLIDNLILLYALVAFLTGRRYTVWEKN